MSFFQGLLMGFAYVAPIGAQNLYVINTALMQPRSRALLTACAVIFFDVTLALCSFFGIGLLMQQHIWLQQGILLLGSLLILYIGFNLLRDSLRSRPLVSMTPPVSGVISAACVVTWCNPQAIIDGSLMLGAFRATLPHHEALLFLAGVLMASCLWFTSLTLLVSLLRKRITETHLHRINMLCAAIIIFYGGQLLLSFARMIGLLPL